MRQEKREIEGREGRLHKSRRTHTHARTHAHVHIHAHYTTPTHRFMLVLASNQPDQFDWAINDCLDDLVQVLFLSYLFPFSLFLPFTRQEHLDQWTIN